MGSEAVVPLAALHDDALSTVLGRLPACNLAALRCVCKAWRDLIDEHRLLLPYNLPQAVRGFFVNYEYHGEPHFFARPAAAAAWPRINGEFGFIEKERRNWSCVLDHCNGLILCTDDDRTAGIFPRKNGTAGSFYVCNPMTRNWKRLPRCYDDDVRWKQHSFLVFDPAVSQHYRVLLVPREPKKEKDDAWRSMKWPPSRWTCHEYSSSTGWWRERVFVREGEAAGTADDLLMGFLGYCGKPRWRFAAYWQGALYVHCRGEYIVRMSLSDAKYRVIKSPIDRVECYNGVKSFLGSAKKGVYFAAIYKSQLRVWILTEPLLDRTECWMLKHDRVLKPDDWWGVVLCGDYHQVTRDGPWILDENEKIKTRDDVEWNSDDDDVIQTIDWYENTNDDEDMYPYTFHVLGFHPYKEVIFLTILGVAVAYHLNSSKVQFLGILHTSDRNRGVTDSFVYTPCIHPVC